MKPLLHRRTFWKGAASGAAAMAALIMGVKFVFICKPKIAPLVVTNVMETIKPTDVYKS